MKQKTVQKIVVYVMLGTMIASSLIAGLAYLL